MTPELQDRVMSTILKCYAKLVPPKAHCSLSVVPYLSNYVSTESIDRELEIHLRTMNGEWQVEESKLTDPIELVKILKLMEEALIVDQIKRLEKLL